VREHALLLLVLVSACQQPLPPLEDRSADAPPVGTCRYDPQPCPGVCNDRGYCEHDFGWGPEIRVPAMRAAGLSSGQKVIVEVQRPFWLARYETTAGDIEACHGCLGEPKPTGADAETARHPVEVPYEAAARFCAATGRRLPLKPEWQAAARGPLVGGGGGGRPPCDTWEDVYGPHVYAVKRPTQCNVRQYSWSVDEDWSDICTRAVFSLCQPGQVPHSMPVGSRPAGRSLLGYEDLDGNVPEWVAGWGSPTHRTNEVVAPSDNGSERLLQAERLVAGASFHAYHDFIGISQLSVVPAGGTRGFRCARDVNPAAMASVTPSRIRSLNIYDRLPGWSYQDPKGPFSVEVYGGTGQRELVLDEEPIALATHGETVAVLREDSVVLCRVPGGTCDEPILIEPQRKNAPIGLTAKEVAVVEGGRVVAIRQDASHARRTLLGRAPFDFTWSPLGRWLVVRDDFHDLRALRLVDTETGKMAIVPADLSILTVPAQLRSLAFSPDDRFLVFSREIGMDIVDPRRPQVTDVIFGTNAAPTGADVAFSPSGKIVGLTSGFAYAPLRPRPVGKGPVDQQRVDLNLHLGRPIKRSCSFVYLDERTIAVGTPIRRGEVEILRLTDPVEKIATLTDLGEGACDLHSAGGKLVLIRDAHPEPSGYEGR
jgi:formylglycine-generating enzyme required for sulfatase activity